MATVVTITHDGVPVASAAVTFRAPSAAPFWQGSSSGRFGMDGLEGACGRIAAATIGGRSAVRASCDDADTGASGAACGQLVNPTNPATALITFCNRKTASGQAGFFEGADLWFYHRLYVPLAQPGYKGPATTQTPKVPGGPGCFPLINASVVMPGASIGMDLMLHEWYGPPYKGPPPASYGINTSTHNGNGGRNTIHFAGPPAYNGYHQWETPLLYDQWIEFQTHISFSTDPTKGFAEIYMLKGGVWVPQVWASNGQNRLYYATISIADNTGPLRWYAGMNYRGKGCLPGLIDLYYGDDHKCGPSQLSVS